METWDFIYLFKSINVLKELYIPNDGSGLLFTNDKYDRRKKFKGLLSKWIEIISRTFTEIIIFI